MLPSVKIKQSFCDHSFCNLYAETDGDYTLYKCNDCHSVVGGSNNKSNVLEDVYVKYRATDDRE